MSDGRGVGWTEEQRRREERAPSSARRKPTPLGGRSGQKAQPQVIFRPHRIRLYAGIVAVLFVAAFVAVAIFLKDSDTDATFYTSDQVAMIGIGVLFALAALWTTWPRVRADNEMIEVRNLLGTRRFTWDLVRHVSFPDGAVFARLELPADEYVPMLAIQAIDRERAVDAMRELRRLHREAGSASS